jgi:hypothetical protein
VGSIRADDVQGAYDAAAAGNLEPLVSLLGQDLEWRGLERGHWLWRKSPS